MSDKIYDVIIVGGGPGGLSAAIYGERAKLDTLLIEKGELGGTALTAKEIDNYPGFPKGTTGPDMMKAFADHAKSFGTTIVKDEVVKVDFEDKIVHTKSGATYQGQTLIIGIGVPRNQNIPGEKEFRGKGVSYCATCDADFFVELDVVVFGNTDEALEEALYLSKFAEKVTLIVDDEEGKLDATPMLQENAFNTPNIEFVWNSKILKINGDGLVDSVIIQNLETKKVTKLETFGVFIYGGASTPSNFIKDSGLEVTERGHIITNERMESNIEGVFAIGDGRDTYLRQVVTAAADGAIAAIAAGKYLSEKKGFCNSVLEEERPVAVMFWSPKAQGAEEKMSLFENIVSSYDEKVKLWKMDIFDSQWIAGRYQADTNPTVVVFNHGEVAGKLAQDEITEENVRQLLDKCVE